MTGRNELFRVPKGIASWAINPASSNRSLVDDKERDKCGELPLPHQIDFNLNGGKIYYITVTSKGTFLAEANPKKPTGGNGEFALSYGT